MRARPGPTQFMAQTSWPKVPARRAGWTGRAIVARAKGMQAPPASRTLSRAALAAAASLLWSCDSDGDQTRVSGGTFSAACLGPLLRAETLFGNAEVEPFLAVDPADSSHLIGVWQQD